MLTAIAAVARNGVIGRDGGLPWHIPEDMRHFRETTMGGALVMGRATFESFGSRPLPGRALFVVSRHSVVSRRSAPTGGGEHPEPGPASGTVAWYQTLADAVEAAQASDRPVFIAGGEQIYRQAWPVLTDLDLTLVDAEPPGDRRFPDIDPGQWEETHREPHDGFSFVRYRRVTGAPAQQRPS